MSTRRASDSGEEAGLKRVRIPVSTKLYTRIFIHARRLNSLRYHVISFTFRTTKHNLASRNVLQITVRTALNQFAIISCNIQQDYLPTNTIVFQIVK